VGLLPGWRGGSVIESLQAELGLPVVVENDADAAAIGESMWGSGRENSSLLFVTVSTGIGAGYVRDRRLVRDPDGQHPEMGHHIIMSDGPACYCGRRGCWEALASGSAVARHAVEARGVDPRTVGAGKLLASDDPPSSTVRQQTARYLGMGLANLISILRPEVVALGGGVMGSWEILRDEVLETIDENTRDVPGDVIVTPATLRPHTALIGAAAAYLRRKEPPCL
ncbi:MAG: ROK family protein, partial [Acidimicrobiia bacterium]